MSDNIVLSKSRQFAIRIVNLYKHLVSDKNEYVLSKQLLRSGTSIGANIHEAVVSQSKKEFIAKMNIALKEAHETEYWLDILHETQYLSNSEYNSIQGDCSTINKLLIAIIKSSNKNCTS